MINKFFEILLWIGFICLMFLLIQTAIDAFAPAPVVTPEPTIDISETEPMEIYIGYLHPETVEKAAVLPIEAVYIPDDVISHDIDAHDVRVLAKLLWSSPLRDASEKRKLLWIVFNRIEDDSGKFGNNVSDVVIRQEFTWYNQKSYISKENTQIATEELNRYLSWKEGRHINRPVPVGYVYVDFSGFAVKAYRELNTLTTEGS